MTLNESRDHYRLPFSERVLVSSEDFLCSGTALDISLGGLLVSMPQAQNLKTNDQVQLSFGLKKKSMVLVFDASVRRFHSSTPEGVHSQVAFELRRGHDQALEELRSFIFELRNNFNTLSSLLEQASPELHSLAPLLDSVQIPSSKSMLELRQLVDLYMRSIQSVENKIRS